MKHPLKFTKDGKVIAPAMFVDCTRRGKPADPGKPANLQDGTNPPASGSEGGQAGDGTGMEGGSEDPNIVKVTFRLMSAAVVVPGIWFAHNQHVDFGHADARALKEAIGCINSVPRPVPVMWNHTSDMQAKAGKLGSAFWEQCADIPPGVNGSVIVDRRFDPKAAIGLETANLDAGSICIDNLFSLSHPDMDIEEFIERQGEDVDGQMVRWLPETTSSVLHYALVPAGADPNSGPRKNTFNQGKSWSGYQFEDPKQNSGGSEMKTVWALLQMICSELGISVAFTENGPMPEKLEERVKAELTQRLNAAKKYNTLAAELEKLGPKLLKEGEVKLTAEQVLERLPGELAFVPQGKAYLEDVRGAALKAFDAAHVKPDKQQMSEVELRERKRIEASGDLEYLKDQLALLDPKASARLGAKVSQNEEIPGMGGPGATDLDRHIRAMMLDDYYAKPSAGSPAGKTE